ncbi:hypothetical protein N0V86_009235 [Didymella sp. IMI 355093]|nr:hypothetical protein N0V86_009235 [Didymella sp. IMI 355093]
MDDLDDELDLRYHRGVKPDVYYRVPTTEGDLKVGDVDVAAKTSELTAIRSIVTAIEEADGFKYSERHAYNPKIGGDGARLNYVCQDSLQNKDRKANKKKKEGDVDGDASGAATKDLTPTYDCGGAIHVKFSIKREAVNVVYKHNPIHRDVEGRRSGDEYEDIHSRVCRSVSLTFHSDCAAPEANGAVTPKVAKTPNGPVKKRKRSKKDHHVMADDGFHDLDLDMSMSPEAPKSSAKKKRKSNGTAASVAGSSKSSAKRGKMSIAGVVSSPVKSKKKAAPREPSLPPRLAKNKACIRCREKKIKCNEAKPACNQCKRGLWACQYDVVGSKQRSKNGCINCKQRRRKCTEEKPYCAYCLKLDDDCEYANYS